jgi:hypothetical protein
VRDVKRVFLVGLGISNIDSTSSRKDPDYAIMTIMSCGLQGSPARPLGRFSIDIGLFLDQLFDNGQMACRNVPCI